MKWFKATILATGILLAFSAVPVSAQDADGGRRSGIWGDTCDTGPTAGSAICADQSGATDVVKRVVNLLLYAIGVLSVIMIIHSGLKYVTSNGDAEKIKSAKTTLQYAIIGVIVALLAFVIVNFVLERFGGSVSGVRDGVNAIGGEGAASLPSVIKTVVDLLLFFVGALSVIMIIFGGFKYITSAGESSGVSSAKNTILYAVIGLIVSVLAYAIVGYVVGAIDGTPETGTRETETGTEAADQVSPPPSAGSGSIGGDASDIDQLNQDGATQDPGTGAAGDISPPASTGGGSIGGDG